MKSLKYLFFIVFIISCSTSKVLVDYDEKSNFANYKTFGFYKNIGEGLNEFDINRVEEVIVFEMQQNGFTESEKPDFRIDFKSKLTEEDNRTRLGIGLGNGGFGVSGGIPIGSKKMIEELKIDFVDAKSEQLFWQGLLKSKVREKRKPEEKELHFKVVISKILSNYPPK